MKTITAAQKAIIERANIELATNFDIPADRIIGVACAQLGWRRTDWETYSCICTPSHFNDEYCPVHRKLADD